MTSESRIYQGAFDIDFRLAEMDLTRETFIKAAEDSFTAYASCTENDPPTFAGIYAWAAANRSLRELLYASGWSRKNETNQPLVINAAKTIAITASSGNENTGKEGESPSNRSSKGTRTRDYIKLNQMTFGFMQELASVIASVRTADRATWLFLIYRDFKKQEMRYELSLPTSMDEDGHVNGWAERIIFPPTPITIKDIPVSEDEVEQSPEITVEIHRIG